MSNPLFPTIIVKCSLGHESMYVCPPWEARMEDIKCIECGRTPHSWKWGGMQELKPKQAPEDEGNSPYEEPHPSQR